MQHVTIADQEEDPDRRRIQPTNQIVGNTEEFHIVLVLLLQRMHLRTLLAEELDTVSFSPRELRDQVDGLEIWNLS
jgi:hypothetical protein